MLRVGITATAITPTPTEFEVQKGDFLWSIFGTFVGTVQLERLMPDKTTWVVAAAPRTAFELVQCSEPGDSATYRIKVTAFTSGTIKSYVEQGRGSNL